MLARTMNGDDIRLVLEKLFHRAAGAIGYELKPLLSHQAPSIDVLDLVVQDLVSRVPEIFVLQIGAHDGRSHDPVYGYIRQFHWYGLLVEPQPAIFETLRKNYREEKQLLFENSAIALKDGSIELHYFENTGANDHASMLTSTRKHYLVLNGDGSKGKLKSITVPALTLESLLDKHGIQKVNFLQIDTEGFDFEIIKMINFRRIRPEIIHYENNFFNWRQKSECSRILSEQGYCLLNLGIDTIAYLQAKREDFTERAQLSKIAAI